MSASPDRPTTADQVVAVIPAFQAASTVEAVVRATRAVLDDVLVVDDGSTDATGAVAERAGARLLRVSTNQGKGTALGLAFRTLLDEGIDRIVTLDADGQHLASEIPRLIETHDRSGASLVLGTRDHLFDAMSASRRFANTVSSRLISRVAGGRLHDIQTGFRLYTRQLLESTGLPEGRFEAETAIVVRALRRRLPIASVPIHLAEVDGRSTSHFRPFVDSARIARALVKVRFEPLPDLAGAAQRGVRERSR